MNSYYRRVKTVNVMQYIVLMTNDVLKLKRIEYKHN